MDKVLNCVECGKEFRWPEAEQTFYAEKGFSAPKRCRGCRAQKKKMKLKGWQQ